MPCLLPLDSTQDAVDEASAVLGRIPLREGDRLVDRNLGRHVARLELVHGDAQRAPLDRAEAVGGPPVRCVRDARVELAGPLGDRLGDAARPRVDLARVLRADLLPGEIPLVEQEQRLPARLATRDASCRHRPHCSSVDVE